MTDSLTRSKGNNHNNSNSNSKQIGRGDKNLFIFNYFDCLKSYGIENDEEFLKEVMEDFLVALSDITRDFRAWNKTHTGYHVMSFACHLKDDSSCLYCYEMKELAEKLYNLAKQISPWNNHPVTGEALQRIYEEILQLEMEFLVAKERLVEELRKYEIYHPDEKKNQQLKRQESKEVEV